MIVYKMMKTRETENFQEHQTKFFKTKKVCSCKKIPRNNLYQRVPEISDLNF